MIGPCRLLSPPPPAVDRRSVWTAPGAVRPDCAGRRPDIGPARARGPEGRPAATRTAAGAGQDATR